MKRSNTSPSADFSLVEKVRDMPVESFRLASMANDVQMPWLSILESHCNYK
jgi:hypothetical protein